MNDIRNAPVFFQVLIKTFETNSKIQDILIFALVQYEWHSERSGIFSGSYKDDLDLTVKYKNLLHDFFIKD
jgi:hypothetical protein